MKIERAKIYGAGIALIALTIMVIVGSIVLSAMVSQMPPTEFVVVDKGHINNWWLGNQYRIYFNHDISYGYILTTESDYNRFQIGDWFNGTVLMVDSW